MHLLSKKIIQESDMPNDMAQRAITFPQVSAENAGLEPWRLQRLKQIVGKLNSFTYNQYKYDLLAKLVKLHDASDHLEITWSSSPSAAERTVTSEVWKEIANIETNHVSHIAQS